MLKWARSILVFLVLGAIVNVAVAWGCALNVPNAQRYATNTVRESATFCDPYAPDAAMIDVLDRFGSQRIDNWSRVTNPLTLTERRGSFPGFPGRVWWPDTDRDAWRPDVYNIASGWPMLSLRARYQFGMPEIGMLFANDSVSRTVGWEYAFVLGERDQQRVVLPLHPITVGFVIDTCFYSVCVAALAYGLAGRRRMIRLWRYQCPACGYPRGTSPVCTECGEALPCSSGRGASSCSSGSARL
ncbi:MAG: hypothetical protein IT430_05050 [Phycisphaerales bacterium]|nr:hypothetical protein [Phycisphaerales bacterium]